jgi:sugar-specific transcriptional regulator TrmB
MNLELLKEIGLTDGEIKVYIALFQLGSTSTGALIKESQVHASKVYPILDRLIEKGLVSFVKEGKKTIYTANPATTIISYLDKLQSNIVDQKKSAEKLIEELTQLKNINSEKSETTVFKGSKGLKNAYNIAIQDLRKGEECYAMFLPKVNPGLLSFFERFIKEVSKKGAHHYLLYNEPSPEAELVKNFAGVNIKVGVQQEHYSPAEICVYGDYTLISTSGGKGYLTVLIKDKAVADSFKNQFKVIWNQKVQTYQGIKGMRLAFDEALRATPKGATSYVFGATKTSKETDKLLFEYNKRRAEKGIKLKILFNEEATSSKTTRSAKPESNPLAEIKIMPKESTPNAYEVFPDRVIITTASSQEPTSIVIKDKEFVKTCKIQFNELWNQKVRTYHGKEGMKSVFNDALNSKEIRFIGGNWGMVQYDHLFFKKWNIERERRKIVWWDLVDTDVLIKQKDVPKQLEHYQVKVLPEQVTSPSVIFIYGNKVALIIWRKEMIINVIESKEIVNYYKKYFDYLWEQDVKVSHGLNALMQAHEKTYAHLKRGEEYVYLGIPKFQPEEQHEYWKKDHFRREQAGIKCRLLFNQDTNKKILDQRNSYSDCDARYMPLDIKTPSYMSIFKETVIVAIPKKVPVVIEINNKEIADSFKAYFEEFWKISKKSK